MSRDTNFYYSFIVLPPQKRDAIIAVWDFCRAVDDAVDERDGEGVRGSGLGLQSAAGEGVRGSGLGLQSAAGDGVRGSGFGLQSSAGEGLRASGLGLQSVGDDGARGSGFGLQSSDDDGVRGSGLGLQSAADDGVRGSAFGARASGAGLQPCETVLDEWRTELARCFGSEAPTTTQGTRLKPFVSMFGLPRQAFADLIDGVEMDLVKHRYETFEALYQYCLRVASAVGLICVEIFGYQDPRARDYAIDLGVALQLTNIIRDVALDLTRGRVYLPADDLARFGCTEAALGEGRVTPPVRALLAYQCARARSYFDRAARDLPPRDARRLVAAEIMGAIYLEILGRIERAGYDVFTTPARVPRPRRALIAARTWVGVMLRSLAPAAEQRA